MKLLVCNWSSSSCVCCFWVFVSNGIDSWLPYLLLYSSTTIPKKNKPNVIITAAILLLLHQWVIQYTYRLESSEEKKTTHTHNESKSEREREWKTTSITLIHTGQLWSLVDHQNEIGSSCSIYFGYCAVVHFFITLIRTHKHGLTYVCFQPKRFYMVLFHFRLTHRIKNNLFGYVLYGTL